MLFLALLYYLLAAQSDPLLAAVGVLPLSEAGRQRTAVALNRALGGARGWDTGECVMLAAMRIPSNSAVPKPSLP